ncbi:dispersed gene family protein 1 (DGF-1), putative, partial [Trypanosoma cruzi]
MQQHVWHAAAEPHGDADGDAQPDADANVDAESEHGSLQSDAVRADGDAAGDGDGGAAAHADPDGVGEQHSVVERRGVPDARCDDDGGWWEPDAERHPRRWERRPELLMVVLPPPFRWASDLQLGKHLSFVPVSTAQPSGFGGPWGAMLSNATWVRNATNPSTVLELAVPVHRGYFIVADETIVIRCDAVAVSGGCRGVLLGSFTIRSNTLPAAASALSAITGVVAGATAVAVVVTGGLGSVLEMQALGVLARMSCASAQERASTVVLPYFLSVFAALDPLWMVVGNALLAAVFGCVHCGVTAAFQRWRGVDAASAWATMRFPSLTYVVA